MQGNWIQMERGQITQRGRQAYLLVEDETICGVDNVLLWRIWEAIGTRGGGDGVGREKSV